MKFKFLFASLAICLIVILGCQKDYTLIDGPVPPNNPNNPNIPTNPVTGVFKAKINGTQWVANSFAMATRDLGIINLAGLQIGGKVLTITLKDSGVHNYTLNHNAMNAAAFVDSSMQSTMPFTTNSSNDPALAGGFLNISSIDTVNKKISGTFNFKGYRIQDSLTLNFTEGVFTNLSYGPTAPPGGIGGTDTFRVKLDGVDWAPGINMAMQQMGLINITSMHQQESVAISVTETIQPGTYNFDSTFIIGNYLQYMDGGITGPANHFISRTGSFTILQHNSTTKRIRGTFESVATSFQYPDSLAPKHFTQGYFSFTYL